MSVEKNDFLLDHVQIAVPAGSETEARRFYGEFLGLEEIPKPEQLAGRGGVWFVIGGHQLHLGVESDFRPARKAHPAFATRSIDTVAARLDRNGQVVRWDDSLPGTRRFFIHDPFGNRLEILEAVSSS